MAAADSHAPLLPRLQRAWREAAQHFRPGTFGCVRCYPYLLTLASSQTKLQEYRIVMNFHALEMTLGFELSFSCKVDSGRSFM